MNEFLNTFLLVYAGLFPIVNPVGGAPIFLGMTLDCSEQERSALARRVAVNGFLLLLAAMFVGSHVLGFFGITMPVLRVAGGSVVTAFGWKLLHAGERLKDHENPGSSQGKVSISDAFYPLTLPLTIGPGSLSVAITLGSRRPVDTPELASMALLGSGAILGLVAISLSVYLCYRFARRIVTVFGQAGINVLLRLSAFILVCIGMEIVWTGIAELLRQTH